MVRTRIYICPKLANLYGRGAVIRQQTDMELTIDEANAPKLPLTLSKKRKRDDMVESGSDSSECISTMDDAFIEPTPPVHSSLSLKPLPSLSPPTSYSTSSSSSAIPKGRASSFAVPQHQHIWPNSNKISFQRGRRIQYSYACSIPGCHAKSVVRKQISKLDKYFETSTSYIESDTPLDDQYQWMVFRRREIDGLHRVYYRCTYAGCSAQKYCLEFWDIIHGKVRFKIFYSGRHDHPEQTIVSSSSSSSSVPSSSLSSFVHPPLKLILKMAMYERLDPQELAEHIPLSPTDYDIAQDEYPGESLDETYYGPHYWNLDDLDTTIDYSYLQCDDLSLVSIYDFPVILDASKTPCIDSFAFCALMRIGAYEDDGSVIVSDFDRLLAGTNHFCRRRSQTADEESRVKTLKRWFVHIPCRTLRYKEFCMRIKCDKYYLFMQIIRKIQIFCIRNGYLRAASTATQDALRPM